MADLDPVEPIDPVEPADPFDPDAPPAELDELFGVDPDAAFDAAPTRCRRNWTTPLA